MKLKDIIKESTLGDLPSKKLMKFNKQTGKFEKQITEDIGMIDKSHVNALISSVEGALKKLDPSKQLSKVALMKGHDFVKSLKELI